MLCFPKKNPHFLQKNVFKKKHDFSRKLEGGTGLQGVNSNLNIYDDYYNWIYIIIRG